jgi:hypothetical protein
MTLIRRILTWLNRRFRIIATDAESAAYDRVDQELKRHGQ